VLGRQNLELAYLGRGEVALGGDHLQLMTRDGDLALGRLRLRDHVARLLDGARGRVGCRPSLVEELGGAGTARHEGALAFQRP
jgi:hypothetical protein